MWRFRACGGGALKHTYETNRQHVCAPRSELRNTTYSLFILLEYAAFSNPTVKRFSSFGNNAVHVVLKEEYKYFNDSFANPFCSRCVQDTASWFVFPDTVFFVI